MEASRTDARDMQAVKDRLDSIVEAVSDDSISLDDALAYYEEAVKLGMRASELMEADLAGIAPADDAALAGSQPDGGGEA